MSARASPRSSGGASRPADAAAAVGALERWFQAAIMHPEGAAGAQSDAGVAALLPAAARSLEEVIEPSREMTAAERLDVYASSYFLRLRDVLRNDFPGVLHALGDEAFARAAREYVVRHPSSSFTLNELGARFPRFLAEEAGAPEVEERRAFLGELAALERAVEDVFHERRTASADVSRLQAIPLERWNDARFTCIPASRLLAFRHPVDRYLQDVYDEKAPAPPAPEPSWVLVYRKEWRSWRARLVVEQHRILEALRRGLPLGAALAAALDGAGSDEERIRSRLGEWFREWTSEGLFAAIEVR